MIEQFWFGESSFKLLGVLRRPLEVGQQWGVLFFPGFGQSKAGPAFIFTRIAQRLSTTLPTFQFDYRGWGDSEGETSDCTLIALLTDAEAAVHELQRRTGCRNLVLIGAGLGNWVAAKLGRQYIDTPLVLILPYRSPVLSGLFDGQSYAQFSEDNALIDTALLGWTAHSPLLHFFRNIGANYCSSKGVLIRWSFLAELAAIDSTVLLRSYPGPVLEFHSPTEEALAVVPNQRTLALPHSNSSLNEFYLSNPMNCDFMEKELFSWMRDIKVLPEIRN